MKVVHGCSLFVSPDHPEHGRVDMHPGRWVLNLALAQKAHTPIEPELIVQVPGTTNDFSTEIEGIPVHYLASPDRFRAATFFYFDARRIGRRMRELNPAIVHAHGTEEGYGLAAQRSGCPYVSTAQGVSFLINRHVPPGAISRQRVVEITEGMFLKRSSDVIAKSEYVAQELAGHFPHLRIHRIPNTFDPHLLEIRPAEREPGLFTFIGRFGRRKGVHLICDAIEILKAKSRSLRLEVFGNMEEGEFPYEIEQKRRLRDLLGDAVVFHGMKSGIEVAKGVARAQALVAPSLEEMFGNQVVEALLVGTHVIVTEETAMAENVARFGNGTIVPQQDAASLAGAMEAVLDGEPVASEAETAKERLIAAFGPERVAGEHLAVYEEILGRAGASTHVA